MKRETFRWRMVVLRRRFTNKGPDTLWITKPENRRYLSGYTAEDGSLTESSGSLLVTRKKALLVTDSRFTLQAEKEAVDFEVVTLKKGLLEELPGLLRRMRTKQLGFEEDFLIWGTHRDLKKRLRTERPGVRPVPMNGIVDRMREIKDPSEIRAMKRSADLMSDILDQVLSTLKPGRTEKEIAWEIEDLARRKGVDGLSFPSIVAAGPNAAMPHAVPTNRKIREKEPVIFDVGLRKDGYCSDMSRTVFLGKPSAKFRKIYRTVRQAQLAALDVLRAGVESTTVDAAARNLIKASGFGDYFGHGLGHGVGLAVHETPRLAPRKSVILEEGMVVTVEPGIYIPRSGGVRLEEMVAVGKNGPRILTRGTHLYDFS